jgi:hypothetical protein
LTTIRTLASKTLASKLRSFPLAKANRTDRSTHASFVPRTLMAVSCLLLAASPAAADGLSATDAQRLAELAPDLSRRVIARAVRALDCAEPEVNDARILAIIDYSLPSTERRLWVFDRAERRLLFHELVAHGKNSGENYATRFSNVDGSRQSSLGLFRTAETYDGGNGYSLRLDGLDPRVNDHARERLIVIHGAWYVGEDFARQHGRLGRSWGCPALEPALARPVIDTLKHGAALFVFAEDESWLRHEERRSCGDDPVGTVTTAAAGR